MLYIVATPIGNLQDITFRAIETLKACDYILCEDTRQSKKLLDFYNIQKPLKSFHLFNEKKIEETTLSELESGKHIALISDAGTPLVSDPGSMLVTKCQEKNIPVTSIPGPCALISALILSGLARDSFYFLGFLPKKKNELLELLEEKMAIETTIIVYESPHRIQETLAVIESIDRARVVSVCRELTKKFESVVTAPVHEISSQAFKGEIVLVIEGKKAKEKPIQFSNDAITYLLNDLIENGMEKKEAIAHLAAQLQIPKKIVYKLAVDSEVC